MEVVYSCSVYFIAFVLVLYGRCLDRRSISVGEDSPL